MLTQVNTHELNHIGAILGGNSMVRAMMRAALAVGSGHLQPGVQELLMSHVGSGSTI